MARRQLEVIDIVEVLQHWHAGRPKSVVAASLGIDPKTVRKYVAPAEAAGLVPGGPALSRAEWAELVRGWFPGLVDGRVRSLVFGVIDAHRERIAEMLKTNTVTTGASARCAGVAAVASRRASCAGYARRPTLTAGCTGSCRPG